MKAIAIHTTFIILTAVMFLFFAIILVFGLINITGLEANQASCTVKLLNYCTSWAAKGFGDGDKPYTWSEKHPVECTNFLKDINDGSGPTKDKCQPIVK
jgi:hypothetical protein